MAKLGYQCLTVSNGADGRPDVGPAGPRLVAGVEQADGRLFAHKGLQSALNSHRHAQSTSINSLSKPLLHKKATLGTPHTTGATSERSYRILRGGAWNETKRRRFRVYLGGQAPSPK